MANYISSARGAQSNFAGFLKTRTGVFKLSGSRVVAILWNVFFLVLVRRRYGDSPAAVVGRVRLSAMVPYRTLEYMLL